MLKSWLGSAAPALLAAAAFVSTGHAETPWERGRYLVEGVVACGNCHSPRDAAGELIAGMAYSGQPVIELPEFTAYAPNITQDRETGIGDWTAADLKRAIREGIRPDGSLIGPPMPIGQYRSLSDGDLEAIVAYIRTVPAVRRASPRSVYRIPLPPSYGPPLDTVAAPGRADPVAYGRYLVALGHCLDCHTPPGEGGLPDFALRLGAGGFELPGPWGLSISANLTSHPSDGLGRYAEDADIKRIIGTGVRPDGTHLVPPMGFDFYAHIAEPDLDAMVAFLRTLPPLPSE